MSRLNDIERARIALAKSKRRAAWDRWAGHVGFEIRVTGPRGVVGWAFAVAIMVTPMCFLIGIGAIVSAIAKRRRGQGSDPGGAA